MTKPIKPNKFQSMLTKLESRNGALRQQVADELRRIADGGHSEGLAETANACAGATVLIEVARTLCEKEKDN
jgi:hypothetical protein